MTWIQYVGNSLKNLGRHGRVSNNTPSQLEESGGSRSVTTSLYVVLAGYIEEAASLKGDSTRLRRLREKYVADHLELASELQSHFQDEDVIRGNVDSACDPPPEFERYTDVTRLGEGGQAVVYEAFDQKLQTRVALKMSKFEGLVTAGEAQRFLFEAQSMAQLSHPNVVRVFDVEDYNGRPFVSMEFIRGGSLQNHLNRFFDDPHSAGRLMVDISRAVHHAHQRGILHRDLKPANILLDIESAHPFVSDFGLAKPIDTASTSRAVVALNRAFVVPRDERQSTKARSAGNVGWRFEPWFKDQELVLGR